MITIGRMVIYLMFAWFDFYIGLYYDQYRNILYFFPIPMFGIVFNFGKRAK